ncbi:hypothetical protein GOBAR_DD01459 [Gossypium barbadense]|nr:hypothetical protein GOBAR_DD01459 [Gossypium barbadense]
MGRKKLKIQRLEDLKARRAKYSKRKTGILKKAKELNILCEVDVALLFCSPSGTPTLYVGKNSKKAYTIEMLRKIYENSESEFDPLSLSHDTNANTLKLYEDELQELKDKLVEMSKILRSLHESILIMHTNGNCQDLSTYQHMNRDIIDDEIF